MGYARRAKRGRRVERNCSNEGFRSSMAWKGALCNTLGVCPQLSSGFELKYDISSGVEDVKVKCMKLSST
jgi:hypothetical protein